MLGFLTRLFSVRASQNSVAIGRDANGAIITIVNGDQDSAALSMEYLRVLAGDCARLPLAAVHLKFAEVGESQVRLPDVYTDLHVVSAPAEEDAGGEARLWGIRMARGEGERLEVIQALGQTRLAVLLGEAGSGKSTLVNYLAWKLAQAELENKASGLHESLERRIPLRLVLREVMDSGEGAALLWSALRREMQRRLGDEAAGARLFEARQDKLRDVGLFLLDGLDEVPTSGGQRARLLRAVSALAMELRPGARVLVTARPYAYADSAARLAGFPVLALAPLDQAQAENFIRHWYAAMRPMLGCDQQTADQRADELIRELQNRPDLADLASRPLLLTLTAALHTYNAKLPEDRADLYEQSVHLLLYRWQQRLDQSGLDSELARVLRLGDATLRRGLEQLAYQTHCRQGQERARRSLSLVEGSGVEESDAEGAADIPEEQALAVFAKLLPADYNPTGVLEFLDRRAGLLLGRGNGCFAFPHRSFQEYLAACHLAEISEDLGVTLVGHLREDFSWWREVFLLALGKKRQGGLGGAIGVLNAVLPSPPALTPGPSPTGRGEEDWHLALAAGLGWLDLRLAQRNPDNRAGNALRERCRAWLAACLEQGALSTRERAEAGDALGLLGDPRPGVGLLPLPPGEGGVRALPDILWQDIPAGEFLMGSDDEDAYDEEKPRHPLSLPAFRISRYPITNAQYATFVEAGGYAERQWWDELGWAWRQGAELDLSPIDNEELKKDYAVWLATRTRRDQPRYWEQWPWNLPNRPVVGVNWFEAQAFCRWLATQTGLDIRLPSEAHWERAARGTDGRRFPWGNEWAGDKANTEEANLKSTCAVGLFPGGASPDGVMDGIGNVWEWTSSRWGRKTYRKPDYGYPYDPTDGRDAQDGPDLRIVRGGSWSREQKYARCTSRDGFIPDPGHYNIGFRVLLSLVNSES